MKNLDTTNLMDLGMDSIAAAALWDSIAKIQGIFVVFVIYYGHKPTNISSTETTAVPPTLIYDYNSIFLKKPIFSF